MSRRVAILICVGVLLGMWQHGMFDHALVNVGLNAKDCATNGFGARFCGDELDDYRRNVLDPARREQRRLSVPRAPVVESAPCDPDGVYAGAC